MAPASLTRHAEPRAGAERNKTRSTVGNHTISPNARMSASGVKAIAGGVNNVKNGIEETIMTSATRNPSSSVPYDRAGDRNALRRACEHHRRPPPPPARRRAPHACASPTPKGEVCIFQIQPPTCLIINYNFKIPRCPLDHDDGNAVEGILYPRLQTSSAHNPHGRRERPPVTR